ncbi:MAG: hypothetical protein FWJ62_04910 [Thermaerobacter sp.]|nr:hypothetical protein [Bacillota bacterium]REJ38342.1 MAG: hypothetical protein DIU84_00455 [Bacillota bacterium]
MVSFVIELDSEAEVESMMKRLRQDYGVTGEMHARAVDGGRWRLVVHSEKNLRDSTIEKLRGQRIDTGD